MGLQIRKILLNNFLGEYLKNYYKYFFVEKKRITSAVVKYKNNHLNNPGDYYSFETFDYFKCIFVHIPKAAGISVSKSLFGNYGSGHRNFKYYEHFYHPFTLKRYFKFTIVRNPYDRLLSAYNFLMKGGMNNADKEFYEKNLSHLKSFQQFVIEYLDEQTINLHFHFKPQVYFLKNKKEEINLDFIGRFENIDLDFKIIAKRIGVKKELAKLNSGKKINNSWKTYYNKEMLEKVNTLYIEDIELLHYSKCTCPEKVDTCFPNDRITDHET